MLSCTPFLLGEGATVSVQVLNEFVAVARRKLNKSWGEVRRALQILRLFCPGPVPLSIETHERALQIAQRYGYSIVESLIIAAALDSGARTLYSEICTKVRPSTALRFVIRLRSKRIADRDRTLLRGFQPCRPAVVGGLVHTR